MRNVKLQRVLVGLLIAALAVGIVFAHRLQLLDYLRLMVLGIALAMTYVTWRDRFADHPLRICVLAAAIVYVLHSLDPATHWAQDPVASVRVFNAYRVTTLMLLGAAWCMLLASLARRSHRFARFLVLLTEPDRYMLVVLVCLGVVFTATELVQAEAMRMPMAGIALRSTKCIDWLLTYVVIVAAVRMEPSARRGTARMLLFALAGLCAVISLIGGERATAAYRAARVPPSLQTLQYDKRASKLVAQREQLLRVFSLNSDEAQLVYEAGYYFGMDNWSKSRTRLDKALEAFPRLSLQEDRLVQDIEAGNYRAAIRTLEEFPDTHLLSRFAHDRARNITACLASAKGDPTIYYFLGLLAFHDDDRSAAQAQLRTFIASVTNHVNALHFLRASGDTATPSPPLMSMQASGWLTTPYTDKPITVTDQQITLLYNQQVKGLLWLPTGTFDIVVWARDAGTPWDIAMANNFDPTCKARLWVGTASTDFRIVSTNRLFQPYYLSATIRETPVQVVIEFLNDTHETERGWDRNLALTRIDCIRKEQP